MSLKTPLCDLLGCRYPIIQTAMGWVAGPELVAASGDAGGFGFLAGATIPEDEIEADILKIKSLTDANFGVNFHMYLPNAQQIVDLVIKHNVRCSRRSIVEHEDLAECCRPGRSRQTARLALLGHDHISGRQYVTDRTAG